VNTGEFKFGAKGLFPRKMAERK